MIEWTREDGLPLSADESGRRAFSATLAVSPLGPGKVCIAGSSGRGWLATATYDPEKGKSAKVFFEARAEPSPGDQRQAFQTNLAFRPIYIYTLRDQLDSQLRSQRVVVGRSTGNYLATDHPLLVDPESGKVEVIKSLLKSFILPYATPREDTLYWATTEYGRDAATQKQQLETRVYRLGYPDFESHLVANHGPIVGRQMSIVGFDDTGMH